MYLIGDVVRKNCANVAKPTLSETSLSKNFVIVANPTRTSWQHWRTSDAASPMQDHYGKRLLQRGRSMVASSSRASTRHLVPSEMLLRSKTRAVRNIAACRRATSRATGSIVSLSVAVTCTICSIAGSSVATSQDVFSIRSIVGYRR